MDRKPNVMEQEVPLRSKPPHLQTPLLPETCRSFRSHSQENSLTLVLRALLRSRRETRPHKARSQQHQGSQRGGAFLTDQCFEAFQGLDFTLAETALTACKPGN